MTNKFFTNEGSNTLLEKFKGIFENQADIAYFDTSVRLAFISSTLTCTLFKVYPILMKKLNIDLNVN